MNTYARQSISKTFLKACTAAVLLVTCLNTQAADSNVNEPFENFRAETMTSIQADFKSTDFAAPSLDAFNAAVKGAVQSEDFRAETLNSINTDLQSNHSVAPSLDALTAALANTHYQADSDTLQAEQVNSVWMDSENILPAIASLGTIEYEVKDAASREATMLAINFVITALESAKSNLAISQQLTL